MSMYSYDFEKRSVTSTAQLPLNTYRAQRPAHDKRSSIADPGPLGLFSFASTTFILSLYNVQVRGITTPNVVLGMAIFTGGLAQLLAGMWEFASGNAFGATAFTSYGAFWMSYATILLPGSGVVDAYKSSEMLDQAIGIYLITWFVFTTLMLIAALRRNVTFVLLFACLALTLLLLAAGSFSGALAVTKAGGAIGIITALVAYYAGLSELLERDSSWFTLPLGKIAQRERPVVDLS